MIKGGRHITSIGKGVYLKLKESEQIATPLYNGFTVAHLLLNNSKSVEREDGINLRLIKKVILQRC